MNKKYKIDCLDPDNSSFASLFGQPPRPSFAELEPHFQPNPEAARPVEKKDGKKRQAARIAPQSQLDLHGLTAEEAETKTRNYLLTQKRKGLTVVRIITGKGLHSPGQGGVLRDLVEQILRDGRKDGLLTSFFWEKRSKEKSGAVLVQLR